MSHRKYDLSISGQPLSTREKEVVLLLSKGLSNKLIANELGISASTAKFHISNCMAKLEVDNRLLVIIQAVRKGYIRLEQPAEAA